MANYLSEAGLAALLKNMKNKILVAFTEYDKKFSKVAKTGSYNDLKNPPKVVNTILALNNEGKQTFYTPTNEQINLTHLATRKYVESQVSALSVDDDKKVLFGNLSYEVYSFKDLPSYTVKGYDIDGKMVNNSKIFLLDVHNQAARKSALLCQATYEATDEKQGFTILNNLYLKLHKKTNISNGVITLVSGDDSSSKKMPLLIFRLPIQLDDNTAQGILGHQDILITNYVDYTGASVSIPNAPGASNSKPTEDYIRGLILLHGYITTRVPNKTITFDQNSTADKETNTSGTEIGTGYYLSKTDWDIGMGGRMYNQLQDDLFIPITMVLFEYTNYTRKLNTSTGKYELKTENKMAFFVYNDNVLTQDKIEMAINDFVNNGGQIESAEGVDSIAKQSSVDVLTEKIDTLTKKVNELTEQMSLLEDKSPENG